MTGWERFKQKMKSPATTTDYVVGDAIFVVCVTIIILWG